MTFACIKDVTFPISFYTWLMTVDLYEVNQGLIFDNTSRVQVVVVRVVVTRRWVEWEKVDLDVFFCPIKVGLDG